MEEMEGKTNVIPSGARSLSKPVLITFIILLLSGFFVWFVSVYRSADRQFANTYTAYRGIEQPDSSKLGEWDRQMNEAYVAAKEAFTTGNKEQAAGHQKVFLQFINTQEQYGLQMNTAYNKETTALVDVRIKTGALDGKKKVLAERIAKNETEILKIGKSLNAGVLDEMKLWRQLNGNFNSFMNGKIDGSTFLANENETGKSIGALRAGQAQPGQKAETLLKKINADWKELKPLL